MAMIAMGGKTMTKPICFSYKDYTDLREDYKNLLDDNQTLMADNRELRAKVQHQTERVNALLEENTDLKVKVAEVESRYKAAASIIEINQGTIDGYHKVFRLQEAELKKLRNEVMNNECSTHDNQQTV